MRLARIPLPNIPLSITMIFWAFNFVAIKEVYQQMSPQALSLARFALMYVVLLAICLIRREPLRLPREHGWRILLSGFISMGLYMVMFLEGMRLTTASEGAIVLATTPIFTYLMASVVRQERFSIAGLLSVLVAFAGVSIVILGGATGLDAAHGTLLGNLIILLSAVVWASAVVVMRPVLVHVSPLSVLTMGMPAALVVLVPYGIRDLMRTEFSAIDSHGWIMFLHIAILSGVVAFAFYYQGIRQIGASSAALYHFFVPPMTALFAWLSLSEKLTIYQAIGLVVIILGVWSSMRARMRAAASE